VLRQFERCKQALRDELQTEPDTETRRIMEIIHMTVSMTQQSRELARQTGQDQSHADPTETAPVRRRYAFDNLGDTSDEYFADGVVGHCRPVTHPRFLRHTPAVRVHVQGLLT
jgi:hypothetical protein